MTPDNDFERCMYFMCLVALWITFLTIVSFTMHPAHAIPH